MSLLVRAALLGGLAYVVARAVRKADGSTFLTRSGADRLNRSDMGTSRDGNEGLDVGWQRSNQPSPIDV